MEEVLGLFQQTGSPRSPRWRQETVSDFLKRLGLPTRWWTPGGYELVEGSTCRVLPVGDLGFQVEAKLTAVVLAAEELVAQGRGRDELSAVATLALSLGLVTVTRKASS
jgi:hypothetical protein